MSKFSLSNGTKTFQLNEIGQVLNQNDNPIGNWTTDKENRVAISTDDGTKEKIEVHWKFNEHNQLCLLDAQKQELFNFSTSENTRPRYELKNAVLKVQPSRIAAFKFNIRGDWSLTNNHQLEFTCDGVESILDGILSDKKSRFIYRVRDKQNARLNFRLGFAGKWEQFKEEDIPKLKFLYNKEGNETGVFEMPDDGKLIIQNGMNQFRYVYDRDNKTFGITLEGFLKVNEKLEISYIIDKQSARGEEMVAQTTFAIQAAFSGNQFDGDLGLVVMKDDNTPGNYKLNLTGDYVGVVGDTRVMVGFRFSQRRNGKLITRKFGIGGAIAFKDGEVTYTLDSGDGQVELHLGVDIHLKNGGDINNKFSLVGEDGQIKTITFLFGISF